MFVKHYWENTGTFSASAMQMDLVQLTQCLKLLPVPHDPFMYVQDTRHSARGGLH